MTSTTQKRGWQPQLVVSESLTGIVWHSPWHTLRDLPESDGLLILDTPGDANGDLQLGSFTDGCWRDREGVALKRGPRRWCYAPEGEV